MKDSTRVALINKEIETYRKFAVVLESLKPVIRSFDGKCINKKFSEAMDDFLKYGKEERSYYINAGIDNTSYGSMFDISIRCYDDIVSGEKDSMGYCNNYYISNRDCNIRVKADEVTNVPINGGKQRLNSKALSEKLDEKIQELHNKAESLEKDLFNVEEMRAELEKIKLMMTVFNGKYKGRITEVFNCNYYLKNNNSLNYR